MMNDKREELLEPGFATEDIAWRHAEPFARLLRETGAIKDGWAITVRKVTPTPRGERANWGIYAIRSSPSRGERAN